MKLRLSFLITSLLAATAFGQPAIRSSLGVLNANSYQPLLAPDSVFVIIGTGLGPATIQSAPAPNYPAALAGPSFAFAPIRGAPSIPSYRFYTSNGALAGVLPSSIAPGTYAVTVTYNQQVSPPQNVTVVARALGIATANSGGYGPAQATIGNVNNGISLARMTGGSVSFGGFNWTLSPAHPGDEIVLWGTGGGADPLNDTGGTSGDQTAAGNFTVNVDGTQIVPVYSGATSSYPRLWQVNFVLPSNIAADCFASVVVTGGGQPSNPVAIAIAAPGQSSCTTSIPAATLAKLDSGSGTVTMAGLNIGQLVQGSGAPQGTVGGVINQYSVGEFILPYVGPKVDRCTILQETYPAGGKEPSAPDVTLDAGPLTLSGPNGSTAVTKLVQPLGPVYNSGVAVTNAGSYTLSGAGGPQVGPFSISTTFPASFSVSAPSVINRSQPLPISWTGFGFNQVLIDINTTLLTSTTVQAVIVTCVVPANLNGYTIPAAALAYLLPNATVAQMQVTADLSGGGMTSAESTTNPNTVIPLVSGGLVDFGGFSPYIDYFSSPAVQ